MEPAAVDQETLLLAYKALILWFVVIFVAAACLMALVYLLLLWNELSPRLRPPIMASDQPANRGTRGAAAAVEPSLSSSQILPPEYGHGAAKVA